jgi:hypothetical protein
MSVESEQYFLYGSKLDYKEYNTEENHKKFEKFENYENKDFDSINNGDGLICLFDGMCGEYIYVGRCFFKSEKTELLDNFEIPELEDEFMKDVKYKIKEEFGIEKEMKLHFVTHYC